VSDETAREDGAAAEEETTSGAAVPAEDGSRDADKPEKGSGVGHRDLYAIIGIAVILFGVVVAFALLCPGAWETGQMMDDEPDQESSETLEEIEPPE
jgi:hypothetical protein